MKSALLAVVVASLIAACGGKSSSPTSPDGSPTPGTPRTLFVARDGSDSNTGSMESPWRTIRHGVSRLRAGDTLYLRGGLYWEGEQAIDSVVATVPGGTSWSNPITIAGYPGERVTIQPPYAVPGLRLSTPAQSYLIFQDFVLDYGNNPIIQEGIYLSGGANHNRFLRLEVRYVRGFGIVFSKNNGNSAFNEVIDCDIHHNGNGSGEVTNGHGAYVSTSDNLFRGNRIYNNQGYGLHFYDNDGALLVSRNVIQDNQIFDNGSRGSTYGVVVAWGDNNRILGNAIYGNPGGVLVYNRSSGTEVSSNTIRDNTPLAGLLIEGATGTVVRSNTIYGNGENVVNLGQGTQGLGR